MACGCTLESSHLAVPRCRWAFWALELQSRHCTLHFPSTISARAAEQIACMTPRRCLERLLQLCQQGCKIIPNVLGPQKPFPGIHVAATFSEQGDGSKGNNANLKLLQEMPRVCIHSISHRGGPRYTTTKAVNLMPTRGKSCSKEMPANATRSFKGCSAPRTC